MKIEQTRLVLPTYAWETADPEPPFLREFTPRGQPIYPYPTQEVIDVKPKPRAYEAVVFESDLLKVTFLPELNGRIYSAFDKINRREMFYNNPVIKPCLFGLRGAWAAVGVEYNFPNSHSTTTLERIPYDIRRHEDGAASFICGAIERVSRMGWSVEVKMHPQKASLQMTSRLFNGTEFPQRFYYWINAGAPVYPETLFLYPPSTHRVCTHPPMDPSSLAYLEYPVHKGRDIRLYKNITRHFPIFAKTMEEDFFGVYHQNLGCGLVHVADHSLVRGRKFWMFSNAHDGRIWMDQLTENGVDYCELQSGPFSLQSDYRMLPPGHIHVQQDAWLPVGEIGGFNAASTEVVANVSITSGSLSVKFSTIRRLDNATLVLRNKTGGVKTQNLPSISPLKVHAAEFLLPRNIAQDDFILEIRDCEGQTVLEYNSGNAQSKTKADDPTRPAVRGGATPEKARYLEQQGYPDRALRMNIKASGINLECRIAAGRLTAAQGRYAEALNDLLTALRAEQSNAEGHYYAGICNRRLEQYRRAEEHLSHSLDNALWSGVAKFELAKISVCRGKYSQAAHRLEEYLAYHAPTSTALALYALVLRKLGHVQRIEKVLKDAAGMFRFDPLLSGEWFFNRKDQKAPASIPQGQDDQQILDIVCRYLDIHQFYDALTILSFYLEGRSSTSVNPLLHYYMGYIQDRIGVPGASEEAYRLARNEVGSWEAASRLETEPVLRAALKADPQDTTALFQIGNLLASKGRWEEAVRYWKAVSGPYQSLARRSEGLYWWKIRRNEKKAASFYAAACDFDGCGTKTIWEYDHLLEELHQHEKRLELLLRHDIIVQRDQRLLLRKAGTLISLQRNEQGLALLEKHNYMLCEGALLPRVLFEKACVQLAESRLADENLTAALEFYQRPVQYPANLGVGKPAANREAEWWCRCGAIWKRLGDGREADRCFSAGSRDGDDVEIDFFPLRNVVAQYDPDTVDIRFWTNEFFKALCSYETGDKPAFEQRLDRIGKFVARISAEKRKEEPGIPFLCDCLLRARSKDPLTACLSIPRFDETA